MHIVASSVLLVMVGLVRKYVHCSEGMFLVRVWSGIFLMSSGGIVIFIFSVWKRYLNYV